MVAPYKKGVRLEYAARDMLQDLGFWVVRSAGSRGLFDIYGIKDGFVLGVQCKYSKKIKFATIVDMLKTWQLYHVYPVFVFREDRKTILYDVVMRCEVVDMRRIKKYIMQLYDQWKNPYTSL